MIYPGAIWKPGAAAGYTRGRNRMRSVKCHYTAGRDSDDLIRNQGLAQWLVTRDGRVIQYAEADALCHDSGEWNDDGPGIEIEYLDEPDIFTPEAYTATAGLVEWLISLGIPGDFYDGPRLAEGTFSGFITHRSLQQSQPHSDWWPTLPRATGLPVQESRMNPELFLDPATGKVYVYDPNGPTATWLMDPDALAAVQTHMALHGVDSSIKDNDLSRRLLRAAVVVR